jgi:hypothetical protein
LLLAACGTKEGDDPCPTDTPCDTVDTDVLPPPCADGTWGLITSPETSVHVSPAGRPNGTGAIADPVDSVAVALALAAATDDPRVALWPGTYREAVLINGTEGHDGMVVEGCSPEESILAAPAPDALVLRVTQVDQVELRGMSVEGGETGIRIDATGENGTGATVASLRVADATNLGILVDGPVSVADISDVVVEDIGTPDGSYGVGVVVTGTATMSNVTVERVYRVGILVSGSDADVSLDNGMVNEVRTAPDGGLGRGIQIQSEAVAEISDTEVSDVSDAGIFAVRAPGLRIRQTTVARVAGATIPGESDMSGDGVVVTSNDGSNISLDPANYPVTLTDNTISDFVARRAGIYLEEVEATVDDNDVDGDGTDDQESFDADVSGSDAPLVQDRAAARPANRGAVAAAP